MTRLPGEAGVDAEDLRPPSERLRVFEAQPDREELASDCAGLGRGQQPQLDEDVCAVHACGARARCVFEVGVEREHGAALSHGAGHVKHCRVAA